MRDVARWTMLAVGLALLGCGRGGDSEAVGTWVLDKDAFRNAATPAVMKNVPPDDQPAAMQQLEQLFAGLSAEFELNDDGTFEGRGEMMGQKTNMKGTWVLEGQKLTLTTTEENGKKKPEPEVEVATLKDGQLFIATDDVPFDIILKRM